MLKTASQLDETPPGEVDSSARRNAVTSDGALEDSAVVARRPSGFGLRWQVGRAVSRVDVPDVDDGVEGLPGVEVDERGLPGHGGGRCEGLWLASTQVDKVVGVVDAVEEGIE